MDGVDRLRQSHPRPDNRRARPGNRDAGGEGCPADLAAMVAGGVPSSAITSWSARQRR